MTSIQSRREVLAHPGDPTRKIRLRIERPEGSESLPAVLVIHGFKGFIDWGFFPLLSRRLAERGWVAVSLNVSGSGIGEDPERFTEDEAFARNTYSKELEDLDQVRDYVEGLEGVDTRRLGLVGHSRGGGMALLHAAARGDYRAVVTWAAIDEVDRVDAEAKRRWREEGRLLIPNGRTGQVHRLELDALEDVERNRAALDILAACKRLESPVLVVHGDEDATVPLSACRRIAASLPRGTELCIEGAGHTFGATHPFTGPTLELEAALGATTEFLASHLA